MCGIAGVIAERDEAVRAALPPMVAAQRHRGPDASGETIIRLASCTLGLGHRRLSIIDLSAAGSQPMRNPQTGDLIIFNGEVYNYRRLREELLAGGVQFAGHSDTEVLLYGLRRWGPRFIDRLEGMFAFAWYDAQKGRLLLARDPLGIKPLYYAWAGDALLFASEVRALLAGGMLTPRLDRSAVAGMLAYGAVPEPHTIFEGVRAFPAGCWQEYDLHHLGAGRSATPQRYWRFPQTDSSIDEREAVHRLRDTLERAAEDHLISDVPVGVFLSAGLDSTIVASLAARHTNRLRTFTVGFADQPQMSESAPAAETARRIGAEHVDIQITGPDALAACRDWIEALDQPSIDGLNTYVISLAVRKQGIIVALSGLGGDELFCGYSSFTMAPRAQRLLRYVGWVPRRVRRGISYVATAGRPVSVRSKAADIAGSDGRILSLFLQARRVLSDRELGELGIGPDQPGLTRDFVPEPALAGLELDDPDGVALVSRLESRLYMGNMLLRDSDANGMAHSLEIRVPMLDRRMLDLGYAIPGIVRRPSPDARKHLLRAAFAPHLPESLTKRRKTGFTLPIGEWMHGPLRSLCAEGMDHLKRAGVLRPAGVDAVWSAFLADPSRLRWGRVMSLVALGLYTRRFGV